MAAAARRENSARPLTTFRDRFEQALEPGRAGHDREAARRKPIPAGERSPDSPPVSLSTPRLVGEAIRQARLLVRKNLALAKAEARVDLEKALGMAKWLGLAALAGSSA